MASPRVVLALAQPPQHEGGAPGRCSVGLLSGLLARGLAVRAVAADGRVGSGFEDDLPASLAGVVDLVNVVGRRPTVTERLDRLRRPIGQLTRGLFAEQVEARALDADVLHLEQLDTAWCAERASIPSLVHLHYRVSMDRSPPVPWTRDFPMFVERAFAERVCLRRRRYVVASSPAVADSLRALSPRSEVVLAPLCLDPGHYAQSQLDDDDTVGLIGTGWWPPTAAAMKRLVSRTWPLVHRRRPQARLLVAGRGVSELGLPESAGVTVVGEVQSGARFLGGIAVLVYPLDRGSGMKVKVLEALASGVPVVTTPAGAEGIVRSDGVIVSESDEDLAAAVLALLADPLERRQRGAAGREDFLRYYSPLPATEPLVELYSRMTGS